MPDQILYDVTVNGQTITVSSDRELTDYEAYMLAKRQMQGAPSVPMGTERYGRPISDTGEEYSDFGTGAQDIGASLAHPQTFTDFGNLLFMGTDPTRLWPQMAQGRALMRQGLANKAQAASDIVKAPVSGAPSRILERLSQWLRAPREPIFEPRPVPATPTMPSGPMSVVPPTESPFDIIDRLTRPAPQPPPSPAVQLQQSPAFRNLPTTEQIWADRPPATSATGAPVATRVAQPLAAATQRVQAAAQAMKVELTTDELDAASRFVMQGYEPEHVIEAIARSKMPGAFQGLPTNADVEANKYFPKMGQKKARPGPPATQRPKGT